MASDGEVTIELSDNKMAVLAADHNGDGILRDDLRQPLLIPSLCITVFVCMQSNIWIINIVKPVPNPSLAIVQSKEIR